MELAIDTSSSIAGVALAENGELLAELNWRTAQNHTVEAIPAVVRLLQGAKREFREITGVVVTRGPGSFNGLRAGVSAAKGMAFALDVPIAGISTLEVEAYPFAFTGLPVCPVHDAGRGELAVAFFREEGGEWRRLESEQLVTLDDLCARIHERTLFCGEMPLSVRDALTERLGSLAVAPGPLVRMRRAGYLVELGRRRLEKGDADNLAALEPIYLRRPHIMERKKKT